MTTEELRDTKQNPDAMLEATKVVASEDIVLDEEDEFLRELRELAGMEEQKPAEPIGAASAGKAVAEPAPEPAPVPAAPAAEEPAELTEDAPAPVEKKKRRAKKEQPELEEMLAPNLEEAPNMDGDDYFFAGWQKGLMLLVGAASVLVLTVLAVLNALQI